MHAGGEAHGAQGVGGGVTGDGEQGGFHLLRRLASNVDDAGVRTTFLAAVTSR